MTTTLCYVRLTKYHFLGPNPMTVSYYNSTAERYRITLDITVQDDFNPHQIDWRKVLDLQDNETVESVTEDLSNPVSW